MRGSVFSYNNLDTPLHRLSGLTKLVSFLFLTFAVMFSYDIRYIAVTIVFALIVLKISRITFRQIRMMVVYVSIFIVINTVLTYLFSPDEGVRIYGTRHQLALLFGRYTITEEQLLYQGTKLLKYIAVIPFGIIFLFTTNPSEFASSLNGVGVPYKGAYALALTLRYFPDIQRQYRDISLAQQARGLDMSRKAPVRKRITNALFILVPLVFSTLDRIELISNAMDLRGFGKLKKRTWYSRKEMTGGDIAAIAVSAAIFSANIVLSVFVNDGRFYNPFVP